MLTGFATDLRYVLRGLRKSPGFTAVAVLSLAIGIGANSAIVGVLRVLLLDPLPLPAPHELMHVYWTEPAVPVRGITQIVSSGHRDRATGSLLRSNYSHALYTAMRAAAPPATSVAGYNFLRDVSVAVDGHAPVVAGGVLADAEYFRVLRVHIALGRAFTEQDDDPGASSVVVLSHAFWQRMFGGDPSAIGRRVRINGHVFEVAGVTAPGFHGLSRGGFLPPTDVTVPLSAQPRVAPRWSPVGGSLLTADNVYWLRLIARLPAGVSHDAVAQRFTPLLHAGLPREAMATPAPVVRFVSADRGDPAPHASEEPLWILTGVVGAVLLIACLNVAGLMLARGVARQREMAVRRAIGAPRLRLVREMLMESMVLALAGGAAGLVLALWSRALLTTLLTAGFGTAALGTLTLGMPLDWTLVAQTTALAVFAALLCGLLPALRLSGLDAGAALKHRAAGGVTPKLTIGRALIALQIGISVPLVVGALLFLRTIGHLAAVDLGFDPRGIMFFRLNPEYAAVPPDRQADLYTRTLQRLQAVPGVQAATLVENPLMSGLTSNNRLVIDGRDTNILMNAVGPGFFDTMGMRVVAGRAPAFDDRPGSPAVAAVNQAAVAQIFNGASPLGRVVRVGSRELEIVGVVNDTRYARPRAEVRPILFDAALQRGGFGGHYIILRAPGAPPAIEADIRRALAEVHPDLPVPDLRSQTAQIDLANARERVFAQLLTLFGGFALLLAAIGLHGVTAYSVSRRTSEIGVRMAVGARPRQVLWLVLRQVVVLAIAGVFIGVPAAIALGPVVRAFLFGVAPNDTTLVATAVLIMLTVAGAAGLLPARRAARLDPLVALRTE